MMNKFLPYLTFFKNENLLKGSLLLFMASMIVNVGNYLFQLVLGKMLGPGEYGNFVTLASLTYFAGVPAVALQTFVAKNSAELASQNEADRLKFLILSFWKNIFWTCLFLSATLLVSLPAIKNFLKIDSTLSFFVLLSYMILILLNSIILGSLLGLQKFKQVGIMAVLEMTSKLFLGILLVNFGLKTPGALIGLTLGTLAALIMGLYFIREILTEKIEKIKINFSFNEFSGVLISTVSVNLLFIVDLILAKHFLSEHDAGVYSSISILGRVLFFLSLSIGNVIIPTTVASKKAGRNYKRNFLIAFSAISLVGLCVVAIYFLFPEIIVGLLYGNSFKEASSYIAKFAFAMFMLSLANIIHNYLISLNLRKHTLLALLAIIAQVLLILRFHNSIESFINIQFIILTSTFIIFLVYWFLVSYIFEKNS